jgi:hypothetical protein
MGRADSLTAEEARERLAYDPSTGRFIIKKNVRHPSLSGRPTHCLDVSGYVQINLKPYGPLKGHRVAWLMHYGTWPGGHIDHINGVRDDNRIENLRVVTNRINAQNKRHPMVGNKTGFLGVTHHGPRYRATVNTNKTTYTAGYFDTPEEAHAAYVELKRKLHEGCTL